MRRLNLLLHKMQIFSICVAVTMLAIATTGVAKAQSAFLSSPYYGTALVTQGYSSGHPAYDYNLSYRQVLAADAGTVIRVRWADHRLECHGPTSLAYCGYGLHVYIQHSNGYVTRYAHLSSVAFPYESSGIAVQGGEVIGTSGNTGWSTGPHLHFEVRTSGGGAVDPNNPSLWKDGQWASPSRPLTEPATNGEIIVDDTTNNTGGFRKGSGGYPNNPCTGNCSGWTGATTGFNGDRYYTLADRGNNPLDQWAEWTPSGMPSEGAVYEVFVYVPNLNATSWQAPYLVRHLDTAGNWTTRTAVVDQYGLNNQWVSIGSYRMKPGAYVYTHDATGEVFEEHCGAGVWCQLGVDAVRFVRRGTIHASDVRYNNGGWTSTITIRNNGGGLATALIKFLQSNGAVACSTTTVTLFAHQSHIYQCTSTAVASAIVESSQDMSVVVSQERSSPYTHEAYAGVGNPASDVRVALVHRNNSGWFSDLFIQNAGSATTNVTTEFIPAPGFGSNQTFTWNNIAPGARQQVNTTALAIGNGSGVFVGSVRVTNSAGQPLAVASTQYKDSGGVSQMMESSNTEPAVAVAYAPLIQNNNAGWLTGLNLSRTGGGTFDVRYYRSDTGAECTNQLVLGNNPHVIYPAPPAGNPCPVTPLARLQVSSAGMVAAVNQLQGTANAATYPAIATPARTAIIAKVRRDSGWSDGIVIGNFNGATANVTVRLFNANGSLNSTPVNNVALGSNRNLVVLGQVPVGFNGSAVITADQPVAVQANSWKSGGGSGDVIGSYPATHR